MTRRMQGDAPAAAQAPITGWLVLSLVVIVVDQVTKIGFDNLLAYGERLRVLPFFDFVLLYNRGAAFSFLAGADGWQRWFFTLLGVIAVPLLIWLIRRHRDQRLFCAALALILGGAVGNVIDRILYGHVVDFLLFYWNDWYFPAFNIADTAITAGAVLMIYDEVWRARKRPQADNQEASS